MEKDLKVIKSELSPHVARLQWLLTMMTRSNTSLTPQEILGEIQVTAGNLAKSAEDFKNQPEQA